MKIQFIFLSTFFITCVNFVQAADQSTMLRVIGKYLEKNEERPRDKTVDSCVGMTEAATCATSKNQDNKQCIWDNDLRACFSQVNAACEDIASRTLCFLNQNPKVQCDWDDESKSCLTQAHFD